MSDPVWQKSSFSGDDASRDCVEVASTPSGERLLRESDEPGTVLHMTPASLRTLVGALKDLSV
ncbi:DUF397 domain-containing protein [Streptomyces bluensis]|uniref:DUF397 domain-containing protein n=1 Tax=Streptomyces bluensis TaxID=33897 RepID=UPI0016790DF1|nr:DUF397 domain-containing protein [Streptomyces bluensis]GGZ70937.1 hypothetical protein GCM10010344_42090 [Streptomyces bluensis]